MNFRIIPFEPRMIMKAAFFLFLLIITIASLLIIVSNDLPAKWVVLILLAFLVFAFILITKNINHIAIAILILNLFFNIDQVLIELPNIGATSGIRIALIDILLALLFIKYFQQTKNGREEHFLLIRPILYAWLFLLLSVTLSMIKAGFPLASVGIIMEMIRCVLLFVLISNFCFEKKNIVFIICLLSIGIIIQFFIILTQNANSSLIQGLGVLGQSQELITERWQTSGQIRPGGTFGHPNNLAHFLAIALPILGSFLIYHFRLLKTILAAVAFVLGFIALLLTYSRMGWASFLIGIIILILFQKSSNRKNKNRYLSIGAIVLLIIGSSISFIGVIEKRFINRDYGAAYVRLPMMKEAISMFLDNPMFGVGPNNYSNSLSKYDIERIFIIERANPVHNEILLHFAELGVMGGIAFVYLWGLSLFYVGKNVKRKDHFEHVIGLGIFSGLLAQIIFLQAQWIYLEGYPTFWVLLGISFGIKSIHNNGKLNSCN